MYTNNFLTCLAKILLNSQTIGYGNTIFLTLDNVLTKIDGTSAGLPGAQFANAFGNPQTTESNTVSINIRCGTGTTPPTISDYELDNKISATDLQCTSISKGYSSKGNRIYTTTFSNATSNDITIRELGLYMTSSYSNTIMLERTVLPSPITIPAGESKAIVYEIGF